MDDLQRKSILRMARGAIEETTDYEMSRIMDNILDPNTSPTKMRMEKLSSSRWLRRFLDREVLMVMNRRKPLF